MGHRSFAVPVIHRPEYTVAYEYTSGVIYGHVDVRKWNSAVARRLRADIDTAVSLNDMPIMALEVPEDNRQPKFLRFCGFEPVGTALNLRGQTVKVYERTK